MMDFPTKTANMQILTMSKDQLRTFIPLFVKICYVQTGKKTRPNHFIGAASSNKVKASINNLLFALEIHLCDIKLLLAEFKKCKGVLIAFLHFTFLKQFKPVKDDSTHLKFHKTMR
jgi:hypothetical protein